MLISNTVYLGSAKATSGTPQYKVMPTPTRAGDIVQYVGETTSTYHKAYFYESYQDGTVPSVATIEQTVGEGLEDLAVNKTTFETQITESGNYEFIARLNREHIMATIDTDSVRMDRDESHDVEGAVAWTPDGETYFYTEELVPDVDDEVFADPDGETVAGVVAEYNAESMGWEFNGEFVDLEDYGITYHIQYVSEPPHQDDVIEVTYAEAYPTYDWRRTNVQPSGGGEGGAVNSVNNIDPDEDGNVELSAENINAEVGGTVDSVQDHLESLRNDLGDLADDVAEKTEKNVITLTGESGTLTSAQIAQVLDDTAVLEIVCDGVVFRLSNNQSDLTYRTFMSMDVANTENVAFKAIYVNVSAGAANYGDWTLEEESAGGGSEPVVETVTGNTPTIANVQGNHIYNCTGTLISLTLTAVETTYAEATIYMTTGASITVNIPASVKTIGYTEFSPNTSYVISFANNIMVIGEINA